MFWHKGPIKLEMDIADLRKNVKNTTEAHEKGVQIEGQTFEMGKHQAMLWKLMKRS